MTSTSLPARLTVTEDAMLDIPISVHPCSSVVEILYANVRDHRPNEWSEYGSVDLICWTWASNDQFPYRSLCKHECEFVLREVQNQSYLVLLSKMLGKMLRS